ncbi:hypothetical protein SAMN04487919_1703 [Bacillus sp. ok061]|uniref:hypothetical protein n=1 Tax=Bacillus sp. ok061 TaxID=1761766 RepID=UPI00077243FC|nr:hypothetical protein [Bacillus sp. ok061]KXI45145.1 hypothetical protein ACS45_01370 [Bacillus cereus]SEG88984.1 hypothetical protein SAMN04487919_1703 [Bacillus sp. ok061]
MLDMNADLISLSGALAKLVAQNRIPAIFDKMKATKESGDKDKIISNLETIINDLIHEKNQVIQIAQAYDEQLIAQKMSEDDITYITTTIIPLLEELSENSDNENAQNISQSLDMIKPLLSKEMFNILQLLGFNFKQAIGEPLTMLIRGMISSKIPTSLEQTIELQIQREIRQTEYYKIVQDKDASQRLLEFSGS